METMAKFEAESFKKITFESMVEFIEKHYPQDKAWFKEVVFKDKDGNPTEKYNHLNTVRKFCEKYAPELLPKAKPKKLSVKDRLKDW